jgi:hypothetical protein
LRQYLDGYLARRGARPTEVRRAAEDKATEQRVEYSHYRRTQADRIFAALPAKERSAIETAARAKAPHSRGTGSLAEIMVGIERARITAEKYPGKILSFDAWQARK